MRIALITTPWSSRSGIADYTRHLLPYLREGADIDLFVEVGREGEDSGGEPLRSVADLRPRDYDRLLYQLGNEAQHAFMVPLVRDLGGTVMLHDWVLFDLALEAFPELRRGGLRGLRRALSEGGIEQAIVYWRNKRRARGGVEVGWHAPEAGGRWCSARAVIACGAASGLRWRAHLPAGRLLVARCGTGLLGKWSGEHQAQLELDPLAARSVELEVEGAGRTPEQAQSGDERTLGAFFRSVELCVAGEWVQANLAGLPGAREPGLSADRFLLALNRSVVRHADAFLVHSDWVGGLILASRNAPTPIDRVHHGVERRWRDEERADLRRELGLDEAWQRSVLVGTFGAVQAHKRPMVLLEALALLQRAKLDARLLWIGEERPSEFDLLAEAERLGIASRVHVTGWLPEARAWRGLAAADLCVQLRGPSTGGTSGGAAQALSLGRPVIVSDLPEFAHLPTTCVLRLAQTDAEVQTLAQLVIDIEEDPAWRSEMEDGARLAVDEELHWRHAARRYLEALETHPHARASRRSLLVRFLHATAKDRAGAAKLTPTGEAHSRLVGPAQVADAVIQQVDQGQDADQASVVDNRQGADAALEQARGRAREGLLGVERERRG